MNTATNLLQKVDWDFPNSFKSEGLHSIHPYPAKFIPEIPRSLIKTLGVPANTCVLDPFCGSGTTLVEAQLSGFDAIGIDLNPIACLISRVKTQPLPPDFLGTASRIVNKVQNCASEVDIPEIPNLDHWFQKDIQKVVAKIVSEIERLENAYLQDALRLALSSILVRVSNQDSDTRYAAIHKNITPKDVSGGFLQAADRLHNTKWQLPFNVSETEVIQQDILTVTPKDIHKPVGLVITSPPYPNAYEYWLYHKYRMFWLGYNPLEVKEKEIGARAHYFKRNHATAEDFRTQMRSLFDLLWQVVVDGGNVCVVIGRSKIHGRIVDNAEIVTEVASKVGFRIVATIPRQIALSRKSFNLAHANIKTEHLLVFHKD